jgi:hypothetical protein
VWGRCSRPTLSLPARFLLPNPGVCPCVLPAVSLRGLRITHTPPVCSRTILPAHSPSLKARQPSHRRRRSASRSPGAGGRTGGGTGSQQVGNRASRHESHCTRAACLLSLADANVIMALRHLSERPGERSEVGPSIGSPSPSCWERGRGGEGLPLALSTPPRPVVGRGGGGGEGLNRCGTGPEQVIQP